MSKVSAQFIPANPGDVTEVEFLNENEGNTANARATDEWASFLDGSEVGALVYVYRQNGDGRSPLEYVDSFPVDEFEPASLLKNLRDKYGGGLYRVQIRHKGRVLSNKLISVAGLIKPELPGQKGADPVTMALIERMDKLSERLNTGHDPMQQMQQMLTMMTMMRSAMGLDKPTNGIKDIIEMMGAVRELRETIEPEPASEPSMLGMLGQALPALITAATQRAPAQPLKPTPDFKSAQIQRAPKPNPSPVIVPNKPEIVPKEETPEMLKQLTPQQINEIKSYLNQACLAASFGVDPEKIAVKILESVHDEKMITIIAQTPDLVEQAAKIVPDVLKHRDWFIDLQEWVKGHLGLESKFSGEFEDDQSDDTDGEPGDGESLTE